jgi:predicted permease
MYSNLIVAVEAVIPLFCLMFIGLMVRRLKLLTDLELAHVNRMVFKVFFFIMMFYNIYMTDIAEVFRPKLLLFGACGVLALFVLGGISVCVWEKDNRKRGAMIQAIFRSNFVLMGIPLVSNIFGPDEVAVTTMMIAVIVPLYNIFGVLDLETFRGGRFSLGPVLRGVFTNPMIVGAILGALFLLLGVPVPQPVLKPLGQIAAATSPVALIILGASFQLGTISQAKHQLVFCVVARLILAPALVLGTAAALGFRGVDFVTLIAIFCTPCAVASFAMAQQMDSDADLAGNCVVFTSGLSCITIFGWILFFKTVGMF